VVAAATRFGVNPLPELQPLECGLLEQGSAKSNGLSFRETSFDIILLSPHQTYFILAPPKWNNPHSALSTGTVDNFEQIF